MKFTAFSKTIALLDCDNFFVSCERRINPGLNQRAVVVLSSGGNEGGGCIVARSNEVKALGIPMGAPYFQFKEFLERHGVIVLPANFALYSDISHRVMTWLTEQYSQVAIYSVDEAFIDFSEFKNPYETAVRLRADLMQYAKIPISIGISASQTLAKLATRKAKKSCEGIFYLRGEHLDEHLANFLTQEVWGIGRRLAQALRKKGIRTALELKNQDIVWLQKHFAAPLQRTALELAGIDCSNSELVDEAAQSIRVSRSFVVAITEKEILWQKIASFVVNAVGKLRQGRQIASHISLFIMSSPHAQTAFYGRHEEKKLVMATDFTPHFLETAKGVFERIYRPKVAYKRAGIILGGLSSAESRPLDLFFTSATQLQKQQRLMQVMDQINERFDKGATFATEG